MYAGHLVRVRKRPRQTVRSQLLDLERFGVDNLDLTDDRTELNIRLLASLDRDHVDLALDLDEAILQVVQEELLLKLALVFGEF